MKSLGWLCVLAGLVGSLPAFSQVLTNQYLSGKYYLRQVSLGTDAGGTLTDARSLLATVTFDGAGGYTFTGQQVIGAGAASPLTGSGKYSVDPAGFVTLDNPLRKGTSVNARVGPEALLGSSTESADGAYDLLVAIPAPSKTPVLAGSYWSATLEFPGGSAAAVRNTFFNLAPGATAGTWANFTVSGHAANVENGLPQSQAVTGATYTLSPDGSGTATFGTGALLSGAKTIYVSADGNVILGGSTANGSHDFFVGVKFVAAGSTTWNNDFWGAGLRLDLGQAFSAYSGSVAARGLGFITWSKRYKMLGAGTFDFTGVNPYTLASNGSGTMELAKVGLGSAGFVGSALDTTAPNAYELYFGALAAPLSGTGVFLNPRGVVNLASYSPAGSPIAPGEFVALFGSGLSTATQQVKALPFPLTLNNVSVLVNGRQAPIYYVAADRVYITVPWGTTGPTATIVVQNGPAKSNTVTVPVAATAPGVFSLDQTGAGAAAIRHLDASVVNAQNPAVKGETISIYLTGLGTVAPPLGDGAAGQTSPLNQTTLPGGTSCDTNSLCVLIGGLPAVISYSGLVPGLAGVYQINAIIPSVSVNGSVPLAIQTPNAFHDQVTIAVQ